MAIVILRTKLQRPPVAPHILPRALLLDQLNEGRQRTLTLISAATGYGWITRWYAEGTNRQLYFLMNAEGNI